MVGSPFDEDDITGLIFANNVPGISFAAKAHPFSLSESVESGGVMPAYDFTAEGFKMARLDPDIF